MSQKLIATGQTGAGQNIGAYPSNRKLPITFIGVGITGSDTITLQVSHDGGTTFNNVYYDGSLMQLTATNTLLTVYGPGIYRGTKSGGAGEMYASYEGNL